jgi:septal ring factor EnvC (AmiA/AmiB activator)
VVLAGMARLDVQPGQFVLAGEPVGAMQSTQIAAASGVELGTVRPVLYVEFRRDGDAINPGPWWAEPY